ncbi:MAG: protein-L-isoaspartate O-methyltransferase [Hyphomicrobiales bacterium]|nr:protein-L-isoaspartate O-methyltransferase [Hyphomicrobiales bacterium]
MHRRDFLATAAAAATFAPAAARAGAMTPFSPDLRPPVDSKAAFVDWMATNRGEDRGFLGQRWDRYKAMVARHDLWDGKDIRAFLFTPREEFVGKSNLSRAYVWHYLDIGFGVTITGPHTVGRMTSVIDVKPGEKVLEIGTGSGYQSAYLSHLTDRIHTIEIIKPLFERTRGVYDRLIARGYSELKAISTRNGDGYYGWPEEAPFDKIIVTCGIDHVPPDLLKQLKPDGIMVIPVGPPGAQHVLKIATAKQADGSVQVARSDIYAGAIIPYVPFTRLAGDTLVGTHDGN